MWLVSKMRNFILLIYIISGICGKFGLHGYFHYISFDDDSIRQGYSSNKMLKWTTDVKGNLTTSNFLIPGFNGSSLLLESLANMSNQLKIVPIADDQKTWTAMTASEVYLSFWMYLKFDLPMNENKFFVTVANGRYLSNPHWCWFYYLEIENCQISSLKSAIVNTATSMAFTFTYPATTFQLNAWNFVTLRIQPQSANIELTINLNRSKGKRKYGSNLISGCELDTVLQFQTVTSCYANNHSLILDDIIISDFNHHSFGTAIHKYDRMFFCPQDVQTENSGQRCKCWEGYVLKTSNFAGTCRDSVTCCLDIDECVCDNDNCPSNSKCRNIVSSLVCSSLIQSEKCTKQPNGPWKCQCDPMYMRTDSESKSKIICDSNMCRNGGCCIANNGEFKCICADGFTGKLCELKTIPSFKIVLPKSPHLSKNNLTFVIFTYERTDQAIHFVWNMGDGVSINTSDLIYMPEGLVRFYTRLDMQLTMNDSVPVYLSLVTHCYVNVEQINGYVSIFNNYFVSQEISFELNLLSRDKICKPKLQLNNVFSKNDQVAHVDGTKSVLVTSIVNYPQHCPRIKQIFYDWRCYAINGNNSRLLLNVPSVNQAYLKISPGSLQHRKIEIKLKARIETTDHETLFAHSVGVIEVMPFKGATIFGGKERTTPSQMDIILFAMSPNQDNTDQEFDWFCWEKDGHPSDFCLGENVALTNTKKQLIIPGKYLQKGMTYLVKVGLSNAKNYSLLPQFTQELIVEDDASPSIAIRCLENCGNKSSPIINTILYVVPSNRRVRWSIQLNGAKILFKWKKNTCPTRNSSMLCIKPKALLSGHVYQFKATFINRRNSEEGYAIYEIEMAEEIQRGTCTVEPKFGITLVQNFNVDCYGFENGNKYLIYEIYQRNIFTMQRVVIDRNMEPRFRNLTLSPGLEQYNYEVQLVVIARDSDLQETRVFIDVTVFPISHFIGSGAVPYLITDFIDFGAIEHLGMSGNVMGANQMASVITDTLEYETNKMPTEKTIDSFAQIRQLLIRNLENNLPYDLITIQQSAIVLEQILNTSLKQLNPETQHLAIELAENLTNILKEECDREDIDTTRRMNSSQSILRALNDLLLARADATKPKANLTSEDPNDYEARDYFDGTEDLNSSKKNTTSKEKEFEINLSSRSFEVMRKLDNVVQGFFKLRLDTTLKGNKAQSVVYSNIHKIKGKQNLHGQITYDSLTYAQLTKTKLSLAIDKFDFNPLPNQPLSTTINTPLVRVSLRNSTMNDVITTGQNLTVDLFFQKPSSQSLINETITIGLQESTDISVHKLDIPSFLGFTVIRIEPDEGVTIKVAITTDHRPSIDDFNNHSYVLPKESQLRNTSSSVDPFTIIVPITAEYIKNEDMYIGILPANNLSIGYTYVISASFANCYSWNEEMNVWSTNGCSVVFDYDSNYLHCSCSHMSLFGGSIFVCPNRVHPILDIHLFFTIVDNPIMLIVLLVIYAIFFMLLPIARRYDKQSQNKKLIVIEDNAPENKYFYIVHAATGYQQGSGTTAHVGMQLRGNRGNSRVFVLGHPTRPIFSKGSINFLLVATKSTLGNINEIMMFHDCYGNRPKWYLREVIIHDIQLDQQWTFPVYQWLVPDKLEGHFQFNFKSGNTSPKFQNKFREKVSEKMSDSHLLYSIFHKPAFSHFTCVQRLSCLLCIRLLTMLVSLLFYGIPRSNSSTQLEIGHFVFSFRQIAIAIESSLIVVPFAYILVFLFKKSTPKENNRTAIVEDETQLHLPPTTSGTQRPKIDVMPNEIDRSESSISSKIPIRSINRTNVENKHSKNHQISMFQKFLAYRVKLPHQCVYLAWTLVITGCFICSYLIILYGLRFGKVNSLNWLVTTVTAVLEGFLIQEPLIIILQVLLIMVIDKCISPIDEVKDTIAIDRNQIQTLKKRNPSHFKFQKRRYYWPLSGAKLKEIKYQISVRKETAVRFVEILGFLVFFLTLWFIVLQVKSPTAFQVSHYVTKTFSNFYQRHAVNKLDEISTVNHLHNYLENVLLSGLYDNNTKMTTGNENQAINNTIQILGVARLRQLRIKPRFCKAAELLNRPIQRCASDYDSWLNDDSHYNPRWLPWTDSKANLTNSSMWIFRKSDYWVPHIMHGHITTYHDYGYVAELGRNLKNSRSVTNYIRKHDWIDQFTRAVFCEFTLYNTVFNYFSQVTIVFEISGTGTVYPSFFIWTFRPFGYFQKLHPSLTITILVFLVLFFVYLIWEIMELLRLRSQYFRNVWNIIDLTILISCVLLFIFYGIYYDTVIRCVQKIRDTKKNVFVSFFPAVTWDTIATSTFGVIVCLNMLKTWKLLTFNRHMYLFIFTIRQSSMAIFNFSVMYIFVLMAFVHSTYLLLGPYVYVFQYFGRNMLHYILFSFGRTSFQNYVIAFPTMGLIIFFLYTATVYYYFMTMFVAIVMKSFKEARKRISRMRNQYEMLGYLSQKVSTAIQCGSIDRDIRRNELWLEIEEKLDEIYNLSEIIHKKLNST